MGNYHDFAINNHVSGKVSTWETLDGKSLTSKELSDIIDEHRVNLKEYLSDGLKR